MNRRRTKQRVLDWTIWRSRRRDRRYVYREERRRRWSINRWKLHNRLFAAVRAQHRTKRCLNDKGLLLIGRRNYQTRGFLRHRRFDDLLDIIIIAGCRGGGDIGGYRLGHGYALRSVHDQNSMPLDEHIIKRLSIEHLSKCIAHSESREVNAQFRASQVRWDHGLHCSRLVPKPEQAVQRYPVSGDGNLLVDVGHFRSPARRRPVQGENYE